MTFDIRAFWLIGALGACGFGLLVLIVKKAYPSYLGRVLSLWGAANVALGGSYAIRLGGPWQGQFVYHVLSNTLVATCLSLEYWAIRDLKRQPSSTGWIVGPPLLMFTCCTWLTSFHRNITIELLVFDIINMSMMVLIARSLLRKEDNRRPFADVIAATVYALLAMGTCGVIVDFFRKGQFGTEYDFNAPRSIFNGISAVVIEGIIFPLFLLMLSERLNRDLVVQAMRDPLTGLYNRRAFEEIAFREMSGASRSGLGLSVLMIDIDHFKQINDQHGHVAGDVALRAAATTLRSSMRDEDFLCRWGGDEFCALLPRARLEHATVVAERILEAFRDFNFHLEKGPIEIALSIGITTYNSSAKDLTELVDRADAALYEAKNTGRNRWAIAPDKN